MSIDATINTNETRRDRWGRYQVVPPEGGKPVGYTRATTIAKTLDDGGGLLGWGKRMVALGLSARPDLLALVATTDPADKRTLDSICERAAEAGGSTIRRDQGIALHSALEVSWTDMAAVPAMFTDEVNAVHSALAAAGLSVVDDMHERIVVDDGRQIAGTFDLLLTDGTRNYIADIKTGSSLIGALAFSVQLAIYANADALYTQGGAKDGSQDRRDPMPEIDTERAVIIHVQPGSTTAQLYWLDISIGVAALDLALAVRTMRKSKPLTDIEPMPAGDRAVRMVEAAFPGATLVTYVDDNWRAWMRKRIAAILDAGGKEHMLRAWPAGVPKLASGEAIAVEQGDELAEAVANVEKLLELPFPDSEPGKVVTAATLRADAERRPMADEGDDIDAELVAEVNAALKQLDPSGRAWVGSVITAATKAKRSVRLTGPGGKPTQRRHAICSALVAVGTHADDDLARSLLSLAIGEQVQPGHDLGDAFGSLSIDEAGTVLKLSRAIDVGRLVPMWDDAGVTLHGDLSAALAA